MEFGILGPLEVRDGERLVALPPQRRQLLALLLCRPNAVVSADRLVEGLWGRTPPRSAGKSLQVQLHHLRRSLGEERRITRRAPGYLLRVASDELDADRFDTYVGQGREAFKGNRIEDGAHALRLALALWRGPAFDGLDGLPDIAEEAHRLTEQRWTTEEDLFEAELKLGCHGDVVARLTALVAEHPFRERLRGHLMVALYRLGRQAEALDVYREGRCLLADGLGLEPGARLRDLERAILTDDPALDAPAVTPVSAKATGLPREIPMEVGTFVGRERDLARVEQLLGACDESGPVVVVVNGVGGVGKSALAIRVARRLAGRFPDGQLYADLQGSAPGLMPLDPGEVLKRFLRALGMENHQIPADTAEAAARFRSLLADRRVLVVLDNAADVGQVHPLLPGGSGCATLVTSRRRLATLRGLAPGGRHHLGVFCDENALLLLGRLIGSRRVAREPAEAAGIVRLCGGLPLAVRIAGARLAARPSWPLRVLADRLSAEQRRLDELQADDLTVRASITVSYADAKNDPDGDRSTAMFQLLGLPQWPDITVPVAAALSGLRTGHAEAALEHLADMRLLESAAPGRYRMHDLVRLFAKEQTDHHIRGTEAHAALERAIEYFIAVGRQITEIMSPNQARWLTEPPAQPVLDETPIHALAEARAWLETEGASVITAVRQAAALPGPPAAAAIRLASAFTGPLRAQGNWADRITVNEIAVGVAERIGDRNSEARAHMFLGDSYGATGRLEEGIQHAERALALARGVRDRLGESGALNACAGLYLRQGRYDQAITCLQDSLAIRRQIKDRPGEMILLLNLGSVHQQAGRPQQAILFHEVAAAIAQDIDDRQGQASVFGSLAQDHRLLGNTDRAIAYYRQSLAIFGELGDRLGQAGKLWGLGTVHHELGHHDTAREYWHKALIQLRETGAITHDQLQTLKNDPHPATPEPIRLNS